MKKTLCPCWKEVSITSRINVYNAYLATFENPDEAMSFEEFDEKNRHKIFKYVKSLYM